MVAEHITRSRGCSFRRFARLTRPGGRLVIYTINKFSPVSIAAMIIPHRLHHSIKRLLWRDRGAGHLPGRLSDEHQKDTGWACSRATASDCFILPTLLIVRFSVAFACLHFLELSIWRLCRSIGLNYPENCLLAVFERNPLHESDLVQQEVTRKETTRKNQDMA